MISGRDIARGVATILFLAIGGVLALGGYFGVGWLIDHVSIIVQ